MFHLDCKILAKVTIAANFMAVADVDSRVSIRKRRMWKLRGPVWRAQGVFLAKMAACKCRDSA
jgi:hypothetical protein